MEVWIQPNHIQEVAALESSKCNNQAMKLQITSNKLELKAILFQDRRPIVIVGSFRSSHHKTSNNQREESQLAELHQRIKFQQIKAI